MSIDERLEALTMTAELLLHETQEHTIQLQEHTRHLQEHTKHLQEHTKHLQEHTKHLQMDGEHIRALVRVAELHQERLFRLESA